MSRRQRREAERAARKKSKRATAQDSKSQTGKQNKERTIQEKLPIRAFRPLRWLWGGLLATVALIGFAYQFRPEIAVDRDMSLNARDPFATQFRVTNEGLLAVYDLRFSCTVNNSMMKDVVTSGNRGQEAISVLESRESTTKNCSIRADSFPLPSNLFFDVTYRSKWFWRQSLKRTKFVNMRDSEGHLEWFKQPIDSK